MMTSGNKIASVLTRNSDAMVFSLNGRVIKWCHYTPPTFAG